MSAKQFWGIALCFLAPLCVGCAASPGVVRGQSPSAAPSRDSMVQQASHHHADYQLDPNYAVYGGSYIPPDCDQCESGHGGGLHCPHEWHPTHNLWYQYEQPHGLVYPADNTPAAVVQYPYYTCKGPDCYFHKN